MWKSTLRRLVALLVLIVLAPVLAAALASCRSAPPADAAPPEPAGQPVEELPRRRERDPFRPALEGDSKAYPGRYVENRTREQGGTGPFAARASSSTGGWIPLFNGVDLTGWTPKFAGHPPGENYRDTFRVQDGVLVVAYDRYDQFDGAFGHLFHDVPYGHYRLRLEYRFTGRQTPGAPGWAFRNSGVMIHGQTPETMRLDQPFPVSIEVQLLGGDGTRERPTGNVCTPGTHVVLNGVLERRHCIDSSSPTHHGDDWVELEIEVRGGEVVRHLVDGVVVMEYEQPQLDPDDADARAWLERRGGAAILTAGTISLQAESHPCEFRRVEVRVME